MIDASVARSAGGPSATDPGSKAARDFLSEVLEICHHLVYPRGSEIIEEWKKHRSGFAGTWLKQMISRKKVRFDVVVRDAALADRILDQASSAADRRHMAKDLHLVEAALSADSVIVSYDEKARQAFARAAGSSTELRVVVWANPGDDHDWSQDPESWPRPLGEP